MEENYSPYCKECSGCGEEGCCSPLMCTQSPNGDYCESYLRDLHFAYKMDKYFMNNIYERLSEEMKNELDEAYDKIYDEVYK